VTAMRLSALWRRVLRSASFRSKRAGHWLVAKLVLGLFSILRLMSVDTALGLSDRIARRIGPWTGRHRIALDNLRHAFPEKSEAEIAAIASDMWANMARLATEYVFLDDLFDYDFESDTPGRVEVAGRDIFLELRKTRRPRIFFTAHTGNFEMFPIAAASFGMNIASLFRAPNNPFLAQQVSTKRKISGNRMVPSKAGAAYALARVLNAKGAIGALVDQKFHRGMPTTFFERPCLTSPLLPRLARQYNADIFPARCIRLPNNRYRLELFEKLVPPRDASGEIDAEALCQMMNDVVEGWVREYPGQWMWFHRRWEIRANKPKGRKKVG
jgi:KDO2-lipid IV(A) lauroyltransferase